jgi:hypothetical protein
MGGLAKAAKEGRDAKTVNRILASTDGLLSVFVTVAVW